MRLTSCGLLPNDVHIEIIPTRAASTMDIMDNDPKLPFFIFLSNFSIRPICISKRQCIATAIQLERTLIFLLSDEMHAPVGEESRIGGQSALEEDSNLDWCQTIRVYEAVMSERDKICTLPEHLDAMCNGILCQSMQRNIESIYRQTRSQSIAPLKGRSGHECGDWRRDIQYARICCR